MELTEQQVHEQFVAAVHAAGGQRGFARLHKLTPAYINDLIHKRRLLSDRLLDILGIEKQVITAYFVRNCAVIDAPTNE